MKNYSSWRWVTIIFALLTLVTTSFGAMLPPKPDNHFNDYAGLIPQATAKVLNDQLTQNERDTGSQILVAIFPSMPDGAELSSYCNDVFNSWKPGAKGTNNGAIFFVFVKDRKARVEVGYGLEGVLTDALTKRMQLNDFVPNMKANNPTLAVSLMVRDMIQASKHEYKGSGTTVRERQGGVQAEAPTDKKAISIGMSIFWVILIILILICIAMSDGGGGSGGRGVGSSSGSSSSSSSSGSFSSGGGSSGGGGSSSSW